MSEKSLSRAASPSDTSPETAQPKTSSSGIVLEPQPSDDPEDPLNWPIRRKVLTTAIWCLGTFAGPASAVGNALGYFVQASVYGLEPIALSYSVVAATAGVAVGPLFAVPLGYRYGKSFMFFWSMVGLLATGIWSALMTRQDQYIPFVLARLFGGLFGGNAVALGGATMLDLFFLHQRGRALTVLNISFLMGIVVGPTFSGFIVASAPWPVQFWWTNGLQAVVILLSFFFLHDTGYDRTDAMENRELPPKSTFMSSRNKFFFFGAIAGAQQSWAQTFQKFLIPFYIGISPVTLACGTFTFIGFGFSAFFVVMLSIFLGDPISEGGYAFNPTQSAAFFFSLWFGIIAAEVYAFLVADRLPLWLCRRNGGVWHPEYRLHALLVPGLIALPISLGLYGASLQYHLHYMVLAVACFLGGFGTNATVPITVTYIIESFKGHTTEVAAILGFYRLAFAIVLPLFIPSWIAKVGAGWTLGMCAFFAIFAYMLVVLLQWKGSVIRKWSLASVASSDEGLHLNLENADSSKA